MENLVSYLDDLEGLQTTIQYNQETYYCDKDTDDNSEDEDSEYEKKCHTFNVTEEKKRIWKCSNDKVVCYHCGKSSHTRDFF